MVIGSPRRHRDTEESLPMSSRNSGRCGADFSLLVRDSSRPVAAGRVSALQARPHECLYHYRRVRTTLDAASDPIVPRFAKAGLSRIRVRPSAPVSSGCHIPVFARRVEMSLRTPEVAPQLRSGEIDLSQFWHRALRSLRSRLGNATCRYRAATIGSGVRAHVKFHDFRSLESRRCRLKSAPRHHAAF